MRALADLHFLLSGQVAQPAPPDCHGPTVGAQLNDALDECVGQTIRVYPRDVAVEQNNRRIAIQYATTGASSRRPAQRRAVGGKRPVPDPRPQPDGVPQQEPPPRTQRSAASAGCCGRRRSDWRKLAAASCVRPDRTSKRPNSSCSRGSSGKRCKPRAAPPRPRCPCPASFKACGPARWSENAGRAANLPLHRSVAPPWPSSPRRRAAPAKSRKNPYRSAAYPTIPPPIRSRRQPKRPRASRRACVRFQHSRGRTSRSGRCVRRSKAAA